MAAHEPRQAIGQTLCRIELRVRQLADGFRKSAIVQAATRQRFQPDGQPLRVEEMAGEGIVAVCAARRWLLGRRSWLMGQGIHVPGGPEHDGPIVFLGRIDNANGSQGTDALGRTIRFQRPGSTAFYVYDGVPTSNLFDIGFNYRLSNLLAAMGRAQLERLPAMSAR